MLNVNKETGELAVYGAGMVGVSVYYAVKALYKGWRVVCFIVSEKEGNPSEVDHIPILSLEEFTKSDRFDKIGIQILVATPENHHEGIVRRLEKAGLENYVCVDSRREAALMERYYGRSDGFPVLRGYAPGEREAAARVYMARFHRDVPLKRPYDLPGWIHPIQAGAALSRERVSHIRDDTGDNISEKNVNYSELSALYWIWKNALDSGGEDTYFGLFHYRRILDVTGEDLRRLENSGIDVVLPYPTIHYPNMGEHHRRYVEENDWEAMTAALKELAPEYGDRLGEIMSQPYFYNYNMFMARKRIFDDFCGWLFPILSRTEELSDPPGRNRADRYIGYLGENLTTLYFMYHQRNMKIAHTGCLMLL